jgi:hypothetical protein
LGKICKHKALKGKSSKDNIFKGKHVMVTHLRAMYFGVGNVKLKHLRVINDREMHSMVSYISISHVISSHVSVSLAREMHAMVCNLSLMHVITRYIRTMHGWQCM